MSDRRMTPDPAAEHDSGISEAYREIATERAPEHLDRAVLDAAARETRPRYSRLRMWTRPTAWAAVVMLSVTLILQTEQSPLNKDGAPAAIEVEAAGERDMEFSDADMKTVDDVAERKAEAPVRKSDLNANREQMPSDARELRVTDDALLERAEEMGRIQQGQNDQPLPAAAARQRAAPQASDESASGFVASPSAAPMLCDQTATAEPETWIECILELEEAGLVDAASRERELLAEAFPDFDAR